MFAVIWKVAYDCGVIDTNDGVIEKMSLDDVKKAAKMGLQISGVKSDEIKPVQVTLDRSLCNWGNNKENLFNHTDKLISVGSFNEQKARIRVDDKSFKFKWKDVDDKTEMLFFNGGVRVVVGKDEFHSWLGR